jgi:hypothetical protein
VIPPSIVATSLTFGGSPSDLYEVEASANGLDRRVGRVQTQTGETPAITDLATTPDGTLFGVSFSTLYQIDRRTGLATSQGSLGLSDVNGLAADATGALYASTLSGLLLRRSTPGWQVIGSFGGSGSSGDLAFSPTGELYGTVIGPLGNDVLVKIQVSTGKAAAVSSGDIGFANVWGLSFVGGRLYGLTTAGTTGIMIQIDPTTGRGTFLRNLTFPASGATLPPQR